MPVDTEPLVRSLADVEQLEQVPLADRGLPASTYEVLAETALRAPDALAWRFVPDLTDVSTSVDRSYADLQVRCHQVVNVLAGLHQGGSRRVTALLSPTHVETPAVILGAQTAGTFCAVNHLLEPEQAAAILRTAGAEVLVALGPAAGRDTWERAVRTAELVPGLRHLVQLRADLTPAPCVAVLEDLLDATPGDPPAVLPGPDDIASYFHTGGTTGAPKIAAHSHRNQVVNAWMMNALADERSSDEMAILAGLPWFHVNAWMVTGLATFSIGATAVVPGPDGFRDPAFYPSAWRLVELYRIVAMSAVPTVYGVLTQVPVDADISTLEHPFVGAAPLTDALAQAFRDHTGCELREGYGCTESTCTVTATPRSAAPRLGSQGLRLPYGEVRLVSLADESEVAPGEPGRVLVRGPHVFAGYVQPDGTVLPATVDGWYDTGDLARLDDDGWLRLTGRAKDLIIRGGHNIDPALIVETMERHPAVAVAAAVGRPDAHAGEVPIAYVQLVTGADVSEDALLAYAQAAVPERAAVPKAVHVLAALPMTAVGKVMNPRLREDAARRAVEDVLTERGFRALATHASTDAGGAVTVRVSVPHTEVKGASAVISALPVRTEVVAS